MTEFKTLIEKVQPSEDDKQIMHALNLKLHETVDKFMKKRFARQLNEKTFNILLNSHMIHTAYILERLANYLDDKETRLYFLNECTLIFEKYIKSIKDKTLN